MTPTRRPDLEVRSGAVLPARRPDTRIASIDIARGIVMVLMAIDHVRVFAGVPAGGPPPGVFLTRWITHFCAPAFIFLAGTSAFLYHRKHGNVSYFLLTRGFWLVALELTFLRLAWTFNTDFGYQMAGVIWCIGWCMVLLAGLVKLPLPLVGLFGVSVMAIHNLMDAGTADILGPMGQDLRSALWKIAYSGFFAGPIRIASEGPSLIVLYSIVPWVGVMAAGYAFGRILTFEPGKRDRLCVYVGVAATGLFIVLRGFNLYGDPMPWQTDGRMPAILSFLSTTKYPASLLFLLMTLGPTIALVPFLERSRGRLADVLALFGRVPLFFYLVHIPLIHALALVISFLRTGAIDPWLFQNHPMGADTPPEGYMWSLGLLYLVWTIATVMLYFACRQWWEVKKRRHAWWVKYL